LRCQWLLIDEKAFIKVSTLRNDYLLGDRIVELPCLVSLRVSNEDALLHVRSKAPKRSLVLLDQDISSAAPNSKPRDIRFDSIERFMRGFVRQSSRSDPVADMNE
jgi:hypothetical protein